MRCANQKKCCDNVTTMLQLITHISSCSTRVVLALFLVGQMGLLAHDVLIDHGQQSSDCEICLSSSNAEPGTQTASVVILFAHVHSTVVPSQALIRAERFWSDFRIRAPPHIAHV
jgi:hypothetical protein